MEVIVQGTINALGFAENDIYYPEPDCFENIRDLIRFLRNDDQTALARRLCGERNIVKCDLIPIMKIDSVADNLFDIALRLAVNLCQPSGLAFKNKISEDMSSWSYQWQIESCLLSTKDAFADVELFKIFTKKTADYFAQEWTKRDSENKLMIERIVVLVRYVLMIGDKNCGEQIGLKDAKAHDQLLLAIFESGFAKLLIDIASDTTNRDFFLWVLEIFALMLKRHEPVDLINIDEDGVSKEEMFFRKMIQDETARQLKKSKHLSGRPTNFAGSYVMKGMKAINKENDMVVQRVITNPNEINHLKSRKVARRLPKKRRSFDEKKIHYLSPPNVLTQLKSFCTDLLNTCYLRLLNSCGDSAFSSRNSPSQDKLEIHYFVFMRFVMEFRRLSDLPINLVQSVLGIDIFHHIQTHLDEYMENARIDRAECRFHGMRAHAALSAYKELLNTVLAILRKSSCLEEKEGIERTCIHILQVEEYRDLSSSVIRKFTPGTFSKAFLRDVVLTNHAYISLVERNSKCGLLKKIIKRQKIRKRKKIVPIVEEDDSMKEERKHEKKLRLWNELTEELSDTIFGYMEPNDEISVIDVLLVVEDEVHQQFAMLFVQQALMERRVADTVGLFRAARCLWPSETYFGVPDISAEDEFLELQAVFFADLSEIEEEWKKARAETYGESISDDEKEDIQCDEIIPQEERNEEESVDSDRDQYICQEKDFSFEEYIRKFARKDVLKWYVFLLSEYETNSADVNKAILKFLHRIAFGLKLFPRLFQISLFQIFFKMAHRFKDWSMNDIKKSEHFELYQFGYHLLKKFFDYYRKVGSVLIVESLFWKNNKECYEIMNGYGSFESEATDGKCKVLWTEELDDEMRSLYNEYLCFPEKPEGVDIVEYIEQGLSKARTRRQILREMKELGLHTFGAKAAGRRNEDEVSATFTPEAIKYMRDLVDQYNELSPSSKADDLIDYIRNRLLEKYTRARIIKQLKYEGIEYKNDSKKKLRSQIWTPELLDQLIKLKEEYGAFHKKGDVVNYLKKHLTVKVSRKDIVSKLAEIEPKYPMSDEKKSDSSGSDDGDDQVDGDESEKNYDQSNMNGIDDNPDRSDDHDSGDAHDTDDEDLELANFLKTSHQSSNSTGKPELVTEATNEAKEADSDDEIVLTSRKRLIGDADTAASLSDVEADKQQITKKRRIAVESDSE